MNVGDILMGEVSQMAQENLYNPFLYFKLRA